MQTLEPKTYVSFAKTATRGLPERVREVIERRYGMRGSRPETLEAIGNEYGITRERVRQIEESGFSLLKRSGATEEAAAIVAALERHLRDHGELRREESLLKDLADTASKPHLLFILDLTDPFERLRESDWHYTLWYVNQDAILRAERFLERLIESLEDVGKALQERELLALAKRVAEERGTQDGSSRALWSYIDVSKRVEQGPFGGYGLVGWPDVTPRGVRDRAFLVMQRAGKPLHFTAIVERMNAQDSSWKEAHLQTVHNELIKDERFVLVGRGLYALQEWGYAPGTVRDVLVSILKDAARPMTRTELLGSVLKVRFVKPNTVSLNLQNKYTFAKDEKGRYLLKR